ncbi:MAG: YigZ family protein [Eubacteriales bacterium]|nr:YigZ family protein [Eubacteriales bacterium]
MRNYKTVLRNGRKEVVINKSRFIGHCTRVLNDEEANRFIQDARDMHRDATHHVFAYVIGLDNEIQRYSDDGEPNGTAGIPIINYLKNAGLTNIAVVVTRYFGGIKLGTGGLARAYSGTAREAVEMGKIVEARQFLRIQLAFDYGLIGKIENSLTHQSILIADKIYGEKVMFEILVEQDSYDGIIENIINLTAGQIAINELDCRYYLQDGFRIHEI